MSFMGPCTGGGARSRKVLSQSGEKYLSQGSWAQNVDMHMSLAGPGLVLGVGEQCLIAYPRKTTIHSLYIKSGLKRDTPWRLKDKASLGLQHHTEDCGLDQTPHREIYLVKVEK